MIRTVEVIMDDATDLVATTFDINFDGESAFDIPEVDFPEEYQIGLIVGPSGSGKTLLLNSLKEPQEYSWNKDNAIISDFLDAPEAIQRLMGVGLNSIPTWLKPYHVLSTGEQFRANLARSLEDGATIDEFTSTVDRTVAKSTSVAVSRYIRTQGLQNITFASCHEDIIDWLSPDWVYSTQDSSLTVGRLLQRPTITLDVFPCSREAWPLFRPHHYLSGTLIGAARCFLATWNDQPVAFSSSIPMPSGTIKNAWREHRTVVLPDYQGLGLGMRLSDRVAQIHIDEGKRYYSRTSHPRMGEYRERSPLWRKTLKSGKLRTDVKEENQGKFKKYFMDNTRIAYSHEYMGEPDATAT